jgi:hypothetical protein
MNMDIRVVVPESMRPEVDGADWFWDDVGDLKVRICPMSDWRYEAMLGIHEQVEAVICKHTGVTQHSVDVFDHQYDQTHDNDCEAGDDPSAPYKREHCFATVVERMLCGVLGVDWKSYSDELVARYPGPRHKKP